MHLYSLYGLVVAASRRLPAADGTGPPDIVVHEHAFRRPSPQAPNPQGYSYATLASGDIHVSWSELFDFLVSPDGSRIDVYAESTQDSEPVYTYLISQVISVALLKKGIESLHASAVAIDGRAVVLIGDSGFGKSTLTAALVLRGARLITDDLLVLQQRDHSYYVAPGALRLKLEPGTAAALGVPWVGVPMADGSGKLVYLLPESQCVLASLPVADILLLAPLAADPGIEPVSLADATRALLAATFNPLHTEPERLAALLREAEGIARRTHIRRLHIPRDLDHIDAVAALVAG